MKNIFYRSLSILFILLIFALSISSCAKKTVDEFSTTDKSTADINKSAVTAEKVYGYDFVLFDSDGNGVKDDVAELNCLGMTGGYGAFRLEVFVSGENNYQKVFDSEQYTIDKETQKKLSENTQGELMIDTIYTVEAKDTDADGCDELVCRQYAWVECHADHVGDVVSTLKITENGIKITEQHFETTTQE